MRPATLELLICPACRAGPLAVSEVVRGTADDLDDGSLRCPGCSHSWQVRSGIPILTDAVPNPDEIAMRDRVAREHGDDTQLEEFFAGHHCLPLYHDALRDFLAGADAGLPVLDVGIGWGVAWFPFAATRRLVGLDFSFESLLLLRRAFAGRGLPVPELICADAVALPFRPRTFSRVWTCQVYQHLPEQADVVTALRRAFGLLAPGGRLGFATLHYAWLYRLMDLVRGRGAVWERRVAGAPFLRRYDVPRLRDLFSRAGVPLEAVHATELLFHPPLRLTWRGGLPAALERIAAGIPGAPTALARQLTAISGNAA